MVGVVSAVMTAGDVLARFRVRPPADPEASKDSQAVLSELRRWRVPLTTMEVAEGLAGPSYPRSQHYERARAVLHRLAASGQVRAVGKLWELQS